MEWLIVAGLVLCALVGIAVVSENRKRREEQRKSTRYASEIEQVRTELLSGPGAGSLPSLEPSHHGYRPVARENLIAIQEGASRVELRSSGSYRTRGTIISIPIAKAVRYRIGSGRIQSEKSWQVTGTGRLVLTDKAIVFESPQKNERITWTQVADIEIMLDGFKIMKRSGPPRIYVVQAPDPRFAAMVELMLAETA